MEKNDTRRNPCVCWPARPATHNPLRQEVGISTFKNRLFVEDVQPLSEWTEALWQCSARPKKGGLLFLFLLFLSLLFCCLWLSSMASNFPVDRSPCATASHKYTYKRKKKKKSNSEGGRTVLCIFGLKSQLSGKQSVDCLVFVGSYSLPSSVADKRGSKLFESARIRVWECVCAA